MEDSKEVQDSSDYKLDKHGKKVKAHRIVFNKGEDDGKKGVSEQMKKSFSQFLEQHTPDLTEEQKNELVAELQEVLGKDASAGEWISDFVHSDNPKFAGKSKEKRKQMALAAYYAKQRNEEVELDEATPGGPLGYLSPEERAKEIARRKKAIKANETPASKRFVDNAMKNIKPKTEETEVQEELKGNQHKLDKNKNGKLDKHDFKLLRKEELEQFEEDYTELLEAFDPDHYQASHEKSKFKDGYRAVLKHKETGREVYVGATAYKSKEHAEGEAETYKKHYSVGSGKATPGANYRHDRAVSDYRKKAKDAGHIAESVFDWKNKARQTSDKSTTMTKHDVKKTSTGTVYTKQRDADGMSKEFNRSGEAAQKRGRGRPKKSSFGEAVEFLMSLDEEMFDSMMEEGFDAFMEHYEQLDEVSKATLGSYVKKAVSGMNGVAVQAHMAGNADSRTAIGKQHLEKARKRIAGIEKATDRLTK